MRYEFEVVGTGRRVEIDFGIGQAPALGETVEAEDVDGKIVLVRRLPSTWAPPKTPAARHFVSHSLPYWYPHHKSKRYDERGRCLFDSWDEVRETTAAANHNGDVLEYD